MLYNITDIVCGPLRYGLDINKPIVYITPNINSNNGFGLIIKKITTTNDVYVSITPDLYKSNEAFTLYSPETEMLIIPPLQTIEFYVDNIIITRRLKIYTLINNNKKILLFNIKFKNCAFYNNILIPSSENYFTTENCTFTDEVL